MGVRVQEGCARCAGNEEVSVCVWGGPVRGIRGARADKSGL